MKLGWRIPVYTVVIAAVVIVLGGELIVREIALNRLRELVEEDLVEATGLPAHIEAMRLELLPAPHLHASGIRLGVEGGAIAAEALTFEMYAELLPLLRGRLVIDSVHVIDLEVHAERPEEEVDDSSLAASIREFVEEVEDDGARLRVRRLQIVDARLFLRSATSQETVSIEVSEIDIRTQDLGEPVSVTAAGEFDGNPFSVRGRVGPIRELLAPEGPYPITARGRVFDAEVRVDGTMLTPLDASGIAVDMSARIPDLALTGLPLPDVGPIVFEGHLSDLDGSLGFEELRIRTDREDSPLEARIQGSVDDLRRVAEVAIDARVSSSRVDFASGWLGAALPTGVGVELSARLEDEDGSLGAVGAIRASGPDDAVTLEIRGRFGDMVELSDLDAGIEFRARDLEALADLFESVPAMPPVGPVLGTARLRNLDDRFSLEEIEVDAGRRDAGPPWMAIRGSVDDLAALAGVSLESSFSVLSVERFGQTFGVSLPPIGAAEGSAVLSDVDGSLGLEEVRLRTPGEGPIDITLSAALDDLVGRNEVALDVAVKSQDLATLGDVFDIELPAVGPVMLEARVQGSDESLSADDLVLSIAESRIDGQVEARWLPGERPFVRAFLQSERARLDDFWPDSESAALSEPLNLETRIPFERLRSVDLDLGISIDRFTSAIEELEDVKAAIRLENGRLLASDIGSTYRGTRIDMDVLVDASRALPDLGLRVVGEGIDLETLLTLIDGSAEATGVADIQIELESQGYAVYQMMLGLNGRIRLVLRDGTIFSTYSRKFVLDLATTAFPFLEDEGAPPQLGCAVADLSIVDGIVTVEELFLEGGDIAIVGTGRIDLPGGLYDLRFDPEDRSTGMLRVAPVVEVRGPLEAPEFVPVRRTVVSSLGRGLLSAVKRAGMKIANPLESTHDAAARAEEACAKVGVSSDG